MVAVTGQHVTQGLTGVGLKAAFRPHEADDDLEHLRRLGVVGGEIHHEEICLPSANQLSSQAARNWSRNEEESPKRLLTWCELGVIAMTD
jgi:hypothetical protein